MGNTSSTSPTSATSSTPVTKATTTTTHSAASPLPITTAASPVSITTAATPVPVTTVATPTATTIASTFTTTTTTVAPTTTTTTTVAPITTTTTTTAATGTTPTSTITSKASTTKNISTTPASTEGTAKPTFYTVAKSLTSDVEKTKSTTSSAFSRWYKWNKLEQQKRDKGKVPWYMNPPITSTDIPTATTTSLTMTTAKIDADRKEASDTTNITAMPSFQLRSTAVYSPPHGDRILSGRNELINTDTSNFKYYVPDNRSKQPVGSHTRATMYKMNTHLKQTPLPTQSSSLATTNSNNNTNVTGDNTSLPTFVSRGLQTDLEPQPTAPSSTLMRYYEKQQPQIVPISAFSNFNSNNSGFFHLQSQEPINQPVLPPVEKTPVWLNDQPYPSLTQSAPSYFPPAPPVLQPSPLLQPPPVLLQPSPLMQPPPVLLQPSPLLQPPPPTSILKKPSTVLPQEISNPLSSQTHDQVLEELRKRNKNTNDGIYRVKKVHLLEKSPLESYPSNVSFNLPSQSPTKANQSISRSEKLFFS